MKLSSIFQVWTDHQYKPRKPTAISVGMGSCIVGIAMHLASYVISEVSSRGYCLFKIMSSFSSQSLN